MFFVRKVSNENHFCSKLIQLESEHAYPSLKVRTDCFQNNFEQKRVVQKIIEMLKSTLRQTKFKTLECPN